MAGQNCPNEGHDHRAGGWLVCFLQRHCSWKSESPPRLLIGSPYGGFYWPPYIVIQWQQSNGRWRLFRCGWRYDQNWKGFIFPTSAWKMVDQPMEKGY